MDNYIQNIHHRKSIRLQGYDYSKSGLYFITICVQNRKCLFGNILRGNYDEMVLNDAGKIADKCWLEIPKHFPNAVLHELLPCSAEVAARRRVGKMKGGKTKNMKWPIFYIKYEE